MRDLPFGTVTFLFTDIEGSTKLLHELGPDGYAQALLEHRRILREAFARHGGVEVDTQGDAFFIAFPTALGAVEAAREAQGALAEGAIRVRMGLHTGTPHVTEEGYVGEVVHKGARIASAGHGGQVLLSKETREAATPDVTDLGEHRVKDFAEPVWIFQLGDEGFPPLKTISNTNLPRPVSSFVGRERELGELTELLRDGSRLLTLTGPGGSGKTRLSIEAASELVSDFRNGVFWVPLASLRDPSLVPESIGETLGAKDGLSEHIGEREMLLLLDNFEQVVDAAPELSSLLEACPNLKLLVTSRELLRVRGEVEYSVPPLADHEAVDLFSTRSGLAADDVAAELCRRLDNLPLAIELAAARTSVLSAAQILDRLSKRLDLLKGGRDAEARQQTLRATIEWSHDLLTDDEKQLFARLSVFHGGSTIEGAETVVEADLDLLQSLVDKSLVRHTNERFWMLETIREFAAERRDESGEAEELRRRHAEHFMAFAEEAGRHDLRFDPGDWLDRLEREQDNIRSAFEWLESSGRNADRLRLTAAFWRFWQLHGSSVEGRRILEAALGADDRPTLARARSLAGASVLAVETGDPAAGETFAEEALALHEALGDAWGVAFSRYMVAGAAQEQGQIERAQTLFEKSLHEFAELGDDNYRDMARRNLIGTYYDLGDKERARTLHQEALDRARREGNLETQVDHAGTLAVYDLEEGDIEGARPLLLEWIRMARQLPRTQAAEARVELALAVRRSAWALALLGKAASAAKLLSCSEVAREEMSFNRSWFGPVKQEEIDRIRSQLDEQAFAEAWEAGRKLTVEQALELALSSLE
jgi:predicted ATPase